MTFQKSSTDSPCLSPLDFWNIECHSIFFQFQTRKKNRFRNKLDFLSSSNLIFTACVACKNQFRTWNKILLVLNSIFFRVWNKVRNPKFENRVQRDTASMFLPHKFICRNFMSNLLTFNIHFFQFWGTSFDWSPRILVWSKVELLVWFVQLPRGLHHRPFSGRKMANFLTLTKTQGRCIHFSLHSPTKKTFLAEKVREINKSAFKTSIL